MLLPSQTILTKRNVYDTDCICGLEIIDMVVKLDNHAAVTVCREHSYGNIKVY